jgi:exopolysaccharide biosynthesis polyprenyl glycosylphosphotransferase
MPRRRARRVLLPAALQTGTIREGEHSRTSLTRDALHRRLLAVADLAAASAAAAVVLLAAALDPRPALVAAVILLVPVSKLARLYDRDENLLHKTTLDEAPALFQVATGYTLLFWLLDEAVATGPLANGQVVLLWTLLLALMLLNRTLARRVALHFAAPERCLVLGCAADVERLQQKLAVIDPLKAEIVGRVPMGREPRASRGEVAGSLDDLDYVLRRDEIDRVIICPGEDVPATLDTIRLVKALGVKVSVLPGLFEVVGSSVDFDHIGGLTLLGLRRYGLTNSSALVKRAFDLAGAGLALALLAPVMTLIAAAIMVSSPGPVLFRQRRIGRGGRPFDILKFRTMRDGADREKDGLRHRNEADGLFKIADDPRVTPIGRLLRRSSLDELPQLINVLRGEMSLVGPRPLVDEEDARIEGWRRGRLDATPGMTGAWQVLGSARIPLAEMVTIDYLYRTNWSLWLDVKLLLRTIPFVLRRRGL